MTSCVLGNDIVASLSMGNLLSLREKVLDAIVRCRVNKMVVMQTMMFKDHINSLDTLMYRPGEEPNSYFKLMVEKYKTHMRKKEKKLNMPTLNHPGSIIHMRKIGKEVAMCGCLPSPVKTRVFAPFRTNMKHFREIVISSSMVMDHLPDRYCDQLDLLVKDWASERGGNTTKIL
ncbi:unnamed protein product [Symbiodinium microadriaticum]|nr:unnamed protein product [Symbiodinium microadriaticum]